MLRRTDDALQVSNISTLNVSCSLYEGTTLIAELNPTVVSYVGSAKSSTFEIELAQTADAGAYDCELHQNFQNQTANNPVSFVMTAEEAQIEVVSQFPKSVMPGTQIEASIKNVDVANFTLSYDNSTIELISVLDVARLDNTQIEVCMLCAHFEHTLISCSPAGNLGAWSQGHFCDG